MNFHAINLANIPYKNKKYYAHIFEILKISNNNVKISSEVVVPLFKAS